MLKGDFIKEDENGLFFVFVGVNELVFVVVIVSVVVGCLGVIIFFVLLVFGDVGFGVFNVLNIDDDWCVNDF